MTSITEAYHKIAYHAISPTANPQVGRTVLIGGASAGIGYSIARTFIVAGAAPVIILGRSKEKLDQAVESLQVSASAENKTAVHGYQCDVTDAAQVAAVWEDLAKKGIAVDVLVLNAATGPYTTLAASSAKATWDVMEYNVLANLRMTYAFMEQGPAQGKVLLNVSTAEIHISGHHPHANYISSKLALASLLQCLATETPVEKLQVLSFHPGAVLTDLAKSNGATEEMLKWDDASLPGAFAVWASTGKAAFLHGRFVWANWDVGELKGMKGKFEGDPGFLRVGLQGLPTKTMGSMVAGSGGRM